MNHLAPKIPFRTKYYICCFNQPDREKIVSGFEGMFAVDETMTGREFCEVLGIDYDAIVDLRRGDTVDNFRYVIEKMSEIPEMKAVVLTEHKRLLHDHISEADFYKED